jgi:hypothetical protein
MDKLLNNEYHSAVCLCMLYIFVCMHEYISVCKHVRMYECMYVRMHVSILLMV